MGSVRRRLHRESEQLSAGLVRVLSALHQGGDRRFWQVRRSHPATDSGVDHSPKETTSASLPPSLGSWRPWRTRSENCLPTTGYLAPQCQLWDTQSVFQRLVCGPPAIAEGRMAAAASS